MSATSSGSAHSASSRAKCWLNGAMSDSTTGRSLAIASSAHRPNPSARDTLASTSARR